MQSFRDIQTYVKIKFQTCQADDNQYSTLKSE